MISLDSNKIVFPLDSVSHWQKDSFFESIGNIHGNEVSRKYSVTDIMPGFKSIIISQHKNEVLIDTSAKILKDNYLKGININTIDQVINTINSTGLIEIDKSGIDRGAFVSIDTTQNIEWQKTSFSDLVHSIQLSAINPKYISELYNKKDNKGLVLKGNQISQKNRLIIYDKLTELTYKKGNKAFLESCNKPGHLIDQAKNIVRVEQNNTSLVTIRKRLETSDNSILSVLNSKANPNYKQFDTITSLHSVEQLELFERYKNKEMTIGDVVRMEGMRNIIEKCGMNQSLVIAFLKSLSPKYWDAYWYDRNKKPGFQKVLQRMRFEQNKTEAFYFDSFNEFKELLRVA